MANIKSKFNEAIAFFANVGVVGKKRTIKFEPVKTPNGKTYVRRTCRHCGKDNAVVFRGFEDRTQYMLWCPCCTKLSFPETQPAKKEAGDAYEGKGRAAKFLNKEQCRATTKAGHRCTRPAKENGYCGMPSHQALANTQETRI